MIADSHPDNVESFLTDIIIIIICGEQGLARWFVLFVYCYYDHRITRP